VSLYVETFIRRPMDEVWQHTQAPALHERWDLRFTEIRYLPRARESEPQRFHYATRIGFGLAIRGEGESTGTRQTADGDATSALRFRSEHPVSLIRDGSGYWKYIQEPDGVRFLTWYDYQTRFGLLGRVVDRVAFRPLMGWATAWSFDRLRLWLEQGTDPAISRRLALTHAIARLGLAFTFAYHGLVPKLLGRHADELAMLRDAGVPAAQQSTALLVAGVAELVFAIVLLVAWRARWPAVLSIGLMLAATVGVSVASPRFLSAAFNPVSLNATVIALAVIDLLTQSLTPSAGRCARAPRSEPR
jgi:uncharacterized membrane protein YphA (DoxX/SURF4 family)